VEQNENDSQKLKKACSRLAGAFLLVGQAVDFPAVASPIDIRKYLIMIRKTAILLGLLAGTLASQAFQGFSDLDFIVGSGANEAALVIDFNDGAATESRAWGYRWDGTASGARMLIDVAAADPLLQLGYSGTAASGFLLKSISYGSQSAVSFFGATGPESEGWGYYLAGGTAGGGGIAGGGSSLPSSWTVSPTGAGEDSFGTEGRFLADGSWDAWSFGSYDEFYNHLVAPDSSVTAAPVPEPSFIGLLAGLSAAVAVFRFRGRRA
jgi:hypothetical protein